MVATNHVMLSDAINNNRFSAEFFDPQYVFKPFENSNWLPIGRILKKCEYGISISMNTEGKGYPIFRMNEIDKCFALRPEKYANISKALFLLYKLKENDVLFNRTNSFDFVGRTGIVKDQTDCTFASYLIRLVPDTNIILPEFLTLYLNTSFGIGQIKRRAMRSINQANVSGAEVKKILIPIFDLSIQRNIAHDFNEAFTAKQISKKLYIDAQSLLEQELRLNESNIQQQISFSKHFSAVKFSKIFETGRIDAQCYAPASIFYENWVRQNVKFDKLSNLIVDKIKGIQQIESNAGLSDYCSIKHIDTHELVGASKCNSTPVTPLAYKDDLLLAITGATIGKIGIVKRYKALAFSGDLLCLKLSTEIDPHYLLVVLDSIIGQIQFNRWITGSTNGHLSPRDIGRVLVPRLNNITESKIAGFVEESLQKRLESEKLLKQATANVEKLIQAVIVKDNMNKFMD